MLPGKIYIDNNLLIRWFLHRFSDKKHKSMPAIIEFLSERTEIKKFISLLSVAELVRTLESGDEFKKFRLEFKYILQLIDELQGVLKFDIMYKDKIDGKDLKGVIITKDIIEYVDKHNHLPDCIHVDIAKSHDLCFVTDEARIGKLKPLYENIMTDNKLMRQP